MNNTILIQQVVVAGQAHANECFCCIQCRLESSEKISTDNTVEELFDEYYRIIHRQEEEQLNNLLKKTKKKILFGYTWGKRCLENTLYSSFGAWLAVQPQYRHMHRSERRALATKVRHATKVFEDWDRIVHNLINPTYKYVDARRFSVEHFYRARNDVWVQRQNKLLGKEKVMSAVPSFCMNKIKAIVDYAKETGIVDDVSGDDEQLQLIAKYLLEGIREVRNEDDGV